MPYTGTLYSFSEVPAAYAGKLHPTSWLNGARVSRALPAPYTAKLHEGGVPREAFVEAHVKLAWEAKSRAVLVADGVVVPTPASGSGLAEAKAIEVRHSGGDLIILDGEAVLDQQTRIACAKVVRDICPAIRLAMYGAPRDGGIREDSIAADKNAKHPMHDTLREDAPLLDLLDYAFIDAYMLHPGNVQRDLQFMESRRRLLRKHFPKCRIIFSAWGRFHVNWNPVNEAMPAVVLRPYASQLTRNDDGVCVFDPEAPRDDAFIEMLRGPQRRPPLQT